MIKTMRAFLLSASLATLIVSPLSAEVIREDDGPMIGAFKVGQWTGRCRRDGWLAGANSESCGAQLSSFVSVSLSRTFKGLTVTLDNEGCRKGTVLAKISPKALAAPNRVEALEKSIQKLIKKQQKKCGLGGEMYPVTREDLADILNETDGLEF